MTRRFYSFLPALLQVVCLALVVSSLQAQEYSESGADSCLPCHGEGSPRPATDIFMTRHASRSDPNAPFSQFQCESCHGPGEQHVYAQQRGDNVAPVMAFGHHAKNPAAEQNQVCMACHENNGRLGWTDSRHDSAELSCASCHQVHRPRDPVFDSVSQQETCFNCHENRRADTLKASSHPLRLGNMTCSDCHDPHNGNNDSLLKQASVNETCATCHMEKQGPYLWEHAPASENCALCHQPHGSNHPALLKKRPPLLCQQCHSPAGHPSLAYTSERIEDNFQNRFLLGRGCMNCHSQVHGSNHPSGATLHR